MRAMVNINTALHIYALQEPFQINILQTKPMSHSVCYKPDSIRDAPASINQLRAIRLTTHVARIMLHKGCNHLDTHEHTHKPTFRSDILLNTAVGDHGKPSALCLNKCIKCFYWHFGTLVT